MFTGGPAVISFSLWEKQRRSLILCMPTDWTVCDIEQVRLEYKLDNPAIELSAHFAHIL
jgi:hypothetical protein